MSAQEYLFHSTNLHAFVKCLNKLAENCLFGFVVQPCIPLKSFTVPPSPSSDGFIIVNVRKGSKSARQSSSEGLTAIEICLLSNMRFQKLHNVFVHQTFGQKFVVCKSEHWQREITFLKNSEGLQSQNGAAVVIWKCEQRHIFAPWFPCFGQFHMNLDRVYINKPDVRPQQCLINIKR